MGPDDVLKDVLWQTEGLGDTHTHQGSGCTGVMIWELAHSLVVIHGHAEKQKQAVSRTEPLHALARGLDSRTYADWEPRGHPS